VRVFSGAPRHLMAIRGCEVAITERHSTPVERAWQLSVLPQGDARRAEAGALRSCLKGRGVDVDGVGVVAVLEAAATAAVPVGSCVDRHAVLFGL
jgi:hypothetical protein